MNQNETSAPCCDRRALVASIYIPAPVKAGPFGPEQPGLGLAQLLCTNCLTIWGVATSGPGQIRIARAKSPRELITP